MTAEDLPCVPEEQRAILAEIAAGRGLGLFFHTRTVAARAATTWHPELGEEYRLAFDLAAPVPLYEGARFGITFKGLTVGVGFVVG